MAYSLTPMPEISAFAAIEVAQDSISRKGIQSLCLMSRKKVCKSSELRNTGTDLKSFGQRVCMEAVVSVDIEGMILHKRHEKR
jgi:hypothetical protein